LPYQLLGRLPRSIGNTAGTKERTLLRASLLILLFTTAVLLVGFMAMRAIRSHAHDITSEGFNRIHNGLTLAQVESILGKPAGYYSQRGAVYVDSTVTLAGNRHDWITDEIAITVWCDGGGRVVGKAVQAVACLEGEGNLLEQLGRWLFGNQ
jgi:hypothetical protein